MGDTHQPPVVNPQPSSGGKGWIVIVIIAVLVAIFGIMCCGCLGVFFMSRTAIQQESERVRDYEVEINRYQSEIEAQEAQIRERFEDLEKKMDEDISRFEDFEPKLEPLLPLSR